MGSSNRPTRQNNQRPHTSRSGNQQTNGQRSRRPDFDRMTPEQRQQYESDRAARRAEREARQREKAAAQKRAREEEQKRKKAERQEKRRVFKGRLLLFVIVFAAVALLAVGLFLIVFHRAPDKAKENGLLTYTYGGETVRTCKRADCIEDGELYFCFNDLAEYLGLAESGTAQAMKFIFPTGGAQKTSAGTGQEEYVVFSTGSTEISVGGQPIHAEIPNRLIGTEVWVAVSFAEEYMMNLSVQYDEAEGILRMARVVDDAKTSAAKEAAMAKANGLPESKVKWDTYYYDVALRLKPTMPAASLSENNALGTLEVPTGDIYELNLISDLSAYEPYMNPTGDMRDAFLILVNEDRTVSQGNEPGDLTDVVYTSYTKPTQQLRTYAEKALEGLFVEMYAHGYYNMAVYSGYRSYDYQASLFEDAVETALAENEELTRQEAEAMARQTESRAGECEHQTGLAVDMDTFGAFTTAFADTDEFAWLVDNAWKFGYVLRYPADKTAVTGESFEPWHFRYVGRYHAKIMHDTGLCLEEYTLLLTAQETK